jgi:hypothetical protein
MRTLTQSFLSVEGTGLFAIDRPVWWREVSRGHSQLAFFVGVNLFSCMTIIIIGFHFVTANHLISKHTIDFSALAILFMLQYFCGIGFAQFVSMLTQHAQSTILATGALIVMTTFNGYVPAWPVWLCRLFSSWWFGQTFFAKSMYYSLSLYDSRQALLTFRYSVDALGETGKACFLMFVIGIVYRAFAYVAMTVMREER